MFISYDNMPENSKVWIYAADRKFSTDEANEIKDMLHRFVESWQSHQMPVKGFGGLLQNRFIVLLADDSHVAVGGCSIDSSLQIIRQISDTFHTDVFNRLRVFYKNADGSIDFCSTNDLKAKVSAGKINAETIVFNPSVATKKELDSAWEVAFDQSQWFKLI